MTRCPWPHCGGRVFQLPPDEVLRTEEGKPRPDPDLWCNLCGRGVPTREPTAEDRPNSNAGKARATGAGVGHLMETRYTRHKETARWS